MRKRQKIQHPQLFVLRVWLAEPKEGAQEWRGDIEHTASREKRYFRDFQVLLDFVRRCCEQAQQQTGEADTFSLPENEQP